MADQQGTFIVEVVERTTGEVLGRFVPMSRKEADRVEAGLNVDLDEQQYYTRQVPTGLGQAWVTKVTTSDEPELSVLGADATAQARQLAEQIVGTLLPSMFLAGEDIGAAAKREREARETNIATILPVIEAALTAATAAQEEELTALRAQLRRQELAFADESMSRIASDEITATQAEEIARFKAALRLVALEACLEEDYETRDSDGRFIAKAALLAVRAALGASHDT